MVSARGLLCGALLLAGSAVGVRAQTDPAATATTLTVRSTLVEVPVLVRTHKGEIVYALTAADFVVTDDGVPQQVRLEEDTDSEPLALAIVVETGGAGNKHLNDYRDLDGVLEGLVGGVEHQVAVVGFDSAPHVLLPFTGDVAEAASALATLSQGGAGDRGAAVLDAVALAVRQLRAQPVRYRRAILLLSETIDQGSETTLEEALRLISDTNTVVYSFGFSSTRSAVSHEAEKLSSTTPGPEHGCFSKQGADAEYEGHYSAQVLDCLSQLAPPLRLGTMAFLAARNALRTNTAQSVTQLTGGEFYKFRDAKDLQKDIIAATRDVPNRYVLSFRPAGLAASAGPSAGVHALKVELRDRSDFELRYRSEYWAEDAVSGEGGSGAAAVPAVPPMP